MTENKPKTVLILGAGRGQIGLYKAARELGIKTIAGTLLENDPICLPLADEVCEMNIINPDEVERNAGKLNFDGVVTCCLDKGLRALGRLTDKYQLPGYPEKTADICNNKYLMKQVFQLHDVPSAPFEKISAESEITELVDKLGGYPVIIKAIDLAGSRGIYKASTFQEARDGFNRAIGETKQNFLIIEKFIDGNEFGAQAFIQNGEILFILPHGDLLYSAKTNVPVGHYVPLPLDYKLLQKVEESANRAIKAVGLDNCAVNLDFIEKNGEVFVLELSGRIGANGLPEMVSSYFNIDYYKMVLLAALGIDVKEEWHKRSIDGAVISRMLFSQDRSGILENLSYQGGAPDSLKDIQLFARKGAEIHTFENSSHCIGQFTVKAPTLEQAKKDADIIASKIQFELID